MGTNYYVKRCSCKTCGHIPEQEHIGKSSVGWTFTFRGTTVCRSWEQWQEYLKGRVIVDEYGRIVTLQEFKELVESKVDQPHNHYDYCLKKGYEGGTFKDDEGHAFIDDVFS